MPGFYDNLRARRTGPQVNLGLPGSFRGTQQGAGAFNAAYLIPQEEDATLRAHDLAGRYDTELADPTHAAGLFSSFYDKAAQGFAAPAMRDFANTISGVQANTAARFGGNASSEEGRNVYNTSDLFSRNLSESLARLAPQAVSQGLDYTGQLGQAAGGAANERDQLNQQVLSGINMYGAKKKKGNLLGAALGAVTGGLKGGLAGAVSGGVGGYSAGG